MAGCSVTGHLVNHFDDKIVSTLVLFEVYVNFHWIKISPSSATFVLQKKNWGKIFAIAVKVAISSMQSLIPDKISVQCEQVEKLAKFFSWQKFLYTCIRYSLVHVDYSCRVSHHVFLQLIQLCIKEYTKKIYELSSLTTLK